MGTPAQTESPQEAAFLNGRRQLRQGTAGPSLSMQVFK